MNDTAKICREISDSADMGKLALSRLIKRCRDASFCRTCSRTITSCITMRRR